MGPTRRPADPLGQQRPWRRRERPAALAASSARPRHARASRLERSRPHSRRGAPPAGSRSRRDGPAASGAQGHQRAAGWVSPRAPLKVGGGTSTKGDMVARLHERLTAGLPDGFTRALAVASACTSLQNLQHQAGAFEAELRKTARESGIVEVSEHARTMGTLGNDLRSPRPVHDLYWSWLVGVGLIESAAVVQAIHRLDLGESLELAAQSGIRPDPSVILQLICQDTELTQRLAGPAAPPELSAQVTRMLGSGNAAIQRRGIVSGLRSLDPVIFRTSLQTRKELSSRRLWFDLDTALDVEALWLHRDEICSWADDIGGLAEILEAVAEHGDDRWLPWLQRLGATGRVAPELPVRRLMGPALCRDMGPGRRAERLHRECRVACSMSIPVANMLGSTLFRRGMGPVSAGPGAGAGVCAGLHGG
jgi:hypothetical protein